MKRLIKRMSTIAVVIVAGIWLGPVAIDLVLHPASQHGMIKRAWSEKASNLQVEVRGRVVRVRPDYADLATYQEFEIELPNGHVVLVQHNLDEAPRVPVANGSKVRLRGEYDWSMPGGVIHWTHDDPTGQREGGWIEYMGERYF